MNVNKLNGRQYVTFYNGGKGAESKPVCRVETCTCLLCAVRSGSCIIIRRLNRCHFLQTSVFCCEVRGQAKAAAACLCLHCLLLI